MVFPFANAAAVLLIFFVLKSRFMRKPNHINSLIGKHVVITGGSSGIGFALARRCLLDGAFITLMARNEENLVKALGTLVQTVGCSSDRILLKAVDVSDAPAVLVAIKEAFRWRPIDILICNAGQARAGLIDEVDVQDLEMVTRTNFLGCVYPVHAALPLMKQRSLANPSSIVFMSSLSGLLFVFGMNLYTPTKYALKGLAECLRMELMPHNIRVNLVCPGFTDTPMLDEADKFACTSELLNKLCFYNRAHAESPDEVATKAMQGVRKGEFLITTGLNGFLPSVLARGVIPAESLTRAISELIFLIPSRIASFVWYKYMRTVLHEQLKENLEKQQNSEAKVNNVHSSSTDDSSAAADDENILGTTEMFKAMSTCRKVDNINKLETI